MTDFSEWTKPIINKPHDSNGIPSRKKGIYGSLTIKEEKELTIIEIKKNLKKQLKKIIKKKEEIEKYLNKIIELEKRQKKSKKVK